MIHVNFKYYLYFPPTDMRTVKSRHRIHCIDTSTTFSSRSSSILNMGKSDDGAAGASDPINDSSCNLSKVVMFVSALTAGTICSLTSKMLLSMKSTGMTGEVEDFSYPLFQTTGMFLGMTAGLFFHFLVLWFRIPFPGYTHAGNGYAPVAGTDEESLGIVNGQPGATKPFPMWMYFFLIFPAVFDLLATSLAMYGLRYVTVSVYQMLRGAVWFYLFYFIPSRHN